MRVKNKKAMSTILLKNIYKEGELDKDSTCKEYLQVAHEGSNVLKFAAMLALTLPRPSILARRATIWVTR